MLLVGCSFGRVERKKRAPTMRMMTMIRTAIRGMAYAWEVWSGEGLLASFKAAV